MSETTTRQVRWHVLLALFFCLIYPSLWMPQKYAGQFGQSQFGQGPLLGFVGAALYAVLSIVGLYITWNYVVPRFLTLVSNRQVDYLAFFTIFLLGLTVAVVYPIVDAGALGGEGSDGDNASTIAAEAILRGDNPYAERTYLDNPIGRLPGALLFTIPFVLLGTSAWQNVFWWGAFYLLTSRLFNNRHLALLLVWVMLLFSPIYAQNLLSGTGRMSNSVYVLILSLAVIQFIPDAKRVNWQKVLIPLLWGISLSSRGTFLVVIPIVFGYLLSQIGFKRTLAAMVPAGVACLAVTVPFYLIEPDLFMESVSIQTRKLRLYDEVVRSPDVLVAVASFGAAFYFLIRPKPTTPIRFIRNATIALAVPVLAMMLFDSIYWEYPVFRRASYGVLYAPWGMIVCWVLLFREQLPMLHKQLHE